jgi:NADPH-dependent curcumin reductase CurA
VVGIDIAVNALIGLFQGKTAGMMVVKLWDRVIAQN